MEHLKLDKTLETISKLIERRVSVKEDIKRLSNLTSYPFDSGRSDHFNIQFSGGRVGLRYFPCSKDEIDDINNFFLKMWHKELYNIEDELKRLIGKD